MSPGNYEYMLIDDFKKVLQLEQTENTFFGLPEISAQEAGMLCGAIALLLGTAWIFKQVARALRS
jgi:flagellar biogenesis protein FliO